MVPNLAGKMSVRPHRQLSAAGNVAGGRYSIYESYGIGFIVTRRNAAIYNLESMQFVHYSPIFIKISEPKPLPDVGKGPD